MEMDDSMVIIEDKQIKGPFYTQKKKRNSII